MSLASAPLEGVSGTSFLLKHRFPGRSPWEEQPPIPCKLSLRRLGLGGQRGKQERSRGQEGAAAPSLGQLGLFWAAQLASSSAGLRLGPEQPAHP